MVMVYKMLVFAKIKCMKIIVALITFISSVLGMNIVEEKDFSKLIQNVEYVNVFVNGEQKQNVSTENVLDELSVIFDCSREMPAFGVALHDDTIAAMECGLNLCLIRCIPIVICHLKDF